MKSITQINLAGLTARKSLSKSDSGILQALHLIAIGGAILPNMSPRSRQPKLRRNEARGSWRKLWITVFSTLHFNSTRHARRPQMKCKLCPLSVSHLAAQSPKTFICVSTIKKSKQLSLSQLISESAGGGSIAKIYVSKWVSEEGV